MKNFNQDAYLRMLKYYYARVNACSITDDGDYLLALLKNEELAIYELRKILEESFDEASQRNDRYTPKCILPLDCSHCLINECSNDGGETKRFWATGNGLFFE